MNLNQAEVKKKQPIWTAVVVLVSIDVLIGVAGLLYFLFAS